MMDGSLTIWVLKSFEETITTWHLAEYMYEWLIYIIINKINIIHIEVISRFIKLIHEQ